MKIPWPIRSQHNNSNNTNKSWAKNLIITRATNS